MFLIQIIWITAAYGAGNRVETRIKTLIETRIETRIETHIETACNKYVFNTSTIPRDKKNTFVGKHMLRQYGPLLTCCLARQHAVWVPN